MGECSGTTQGKNQSFVSLNNQHPVHFVKANGAASPKVFKLKQLTLQPGERTLLKGSVSFKILTTRKPYPGSHKIELLVNGVAFPLGRIQVA